jgi:muramoyltetrapeptide carboxypeptidase
MPAADLPNADDITLASFKKNLFADTVSPHTHEIIKKGSTKIITKGFAKGKLTGGNLTVIASLTGTPYEINTKGRILFLEETGEPPYRIDRLLLQLKQSGKLKDASGFILGDFSPENLQTIKLAVSELLIPEGKPILAGFPCGHCIPNITLPLGQTVEISTESLHPLQICDRPQTATERRRF